MSRPVTELRESRRPERVIRAGSRPYTGTEYLESLRDGREVYINGERIPDVTAHPSMRNAARSVARLYDALHDPAKQAVLTCSTDSAVVQGEGDAAGFTHRYFRVPRSREDLVASQKAIAAWARMSYGWMGRTPDYKAAFTNTLGANPEFYGPYADNARRWYATAQRTVPFMNHAIVNPPIDRHKHVSDVKDVYIHVKRETDAGVIVSGAKVVATSAALTHCNFIGQTPKAATDDLEMALSFIVPMSRPGVKLFCRASYETIAHETGTPFDYPLSSRFDENDAILVLDDVLVPWEDVLIYRDPERILRFYGGSGFMSGFLFQACTRFAVKLDFLAGLLGKALRATGGDEFRGNKALLGEVFAHRNLFWSLSDAMANNPDPWKNGAVLPERKAAISYNVFAPETYPRVREIIQRTVASGLVYLPSSARDLVSPAIAPYMEKYVRGSHGMGSTERIKIMKLLWDAVGTEFAGRHELYERNYGGSWDDVRLSALAEAEKSGRVRETEELVDACLSDYDVGGWTGSTWLNPGDGANDPTGARNVAA